jgi:uncharacterized membrane protein
MSMSQLDYNSPLNGRWEATSPVPWMRASHRVIWVLSAIISLLSARYILVESNFHYPPLLYLAQLIVTAIVAIVRHLQLSDKENAVAETSRRSSSRWGPFISICALCVSAVSMLLMLQAILYNENLPTLIMLVVSHSSFLLCFD